MPSPLGRGKSLEDGADISTPMSHFTQKIKMDYESKYKTQNNKT